MLNPAPDLLQQTAKRRKALAEKMRAAGGGIAVISTAPELNRNRDTEYPYRWDSYFYYLTGFTEPQACLVICATEQATQSLLFCREKSIEREIWDGFRFGPAQAKAIFGLDEAYVIGELDNRLPGLLANQRHVFMPLGNPGEASEQLQRWLGQVRAQSRSGLSAPASQIDVLTLIDEMRLRKDGYEQQVMRKAAAISAQAHRRAMLATRPGRFEYEIEAELLYEFKRNGSQFPAYGSIALSRKC
jgi:Xaa-Pro aminopeptidase